MKSPHPGDTLCPHLCPPPKGIRHRRPPSFLKTRLLPDRPQDHAHVKATLTHWRPFLCLLPWAVSPGSQLSPLSVSFPHPQELQSPQCVSPPQTGLLGGRRTRSSSLLLSAQDCSRTSPVFNTKTTPEGPRLVKADGFVAEQSSCQEQLKKLNKL